MENGNEENRRSSIRTMKSDSDELLNQKKVSFIDLIAKEKKGKFPRTSISQPSSSSSSNIPKLVIFFIIIILLIGGGVYVISSVLPTSDTTTVEVFIPRAYFNADSQNNIRVKEGDRTGLLEELTKNLSKSISSGGIVYQPLIFYDFDGREYVTNPKEFFDTLKIKPPSTLYENISKRWNLFTSGGDYLMLFEINGNKKDVLGTMHSWESSMPKALSPILKDIDLGVHNFSDLIIRNTDVRIVSLSNRLDTTIAYSIVLSRFLVITTSETSMRSIIDRLIAGPLNL